MAWTDERIDQLKNLWEKGLTASQIAEELGGVSRNAVIGKAHRLDLKSRPSPVKSGEAKRKAAPAKTAAPKAAAKPRDPIPAAAAPVSADTAPSISANPSPRGPTTSIPSSIAAMPERSTADMPRIVSIGPGGFMRQGPGDQQPPIPPAPPRRLVPAKPSADMAGKTGLLDLTERVCRWPLGHPGEPDFHFCGDAVNPGFPYCVAHCSRAYQAQLPRGVRRAPPPMPFGGPRVR
ncbi:MAG: GcrA cell cycle regulator [Sphingorhabdus sp.]|nr:GcrA cell cycle regulator [Sphingorhabdus sp.]